MPYLISSLYVTQTAPASDAENLTKAIPMTAALGLRIASPFTLNLQFAYFSLFRWGPMCFPRYLLTVALIMPVCCPLCLTLCTSEVSTAVCPATLWVPFTAPWLGFRVVGKHVWAGTCTLTFTCLLTVLTLRFHFVYHLNPPQGQQCTWWDTLSSFSKAWHSAPYLYWGLKPVLAGYLPSGLMVPGWSFSTLFQVARMSLDQAFPIGAILFHCGWPGHSPSHSNISHKRVGSRKDKRGTNWKSYFWV